MDDKEQTGEPVGASETSPAKTKKEPSKFGLFMGKLLRRATGVLAIFALGIVLTWLVQVNPRAKEVRTLEDQLEAANLKIETIEKDLDALKDVKANLDEAQTHLSLLSALVDVSSAQLAISADNLETAQAALAETDAKLDFLLENLGNAQKEAIESMQARLSLVISELGADAFAAQSDLEVLRNSILALERSLFGD